MAGRKISGIFVPIQLDTSNVQRDMESLNTQLGTVINSIQKKFEGSLNTVKLAKGVVDVTRAMGDLRDSADALSKVEIGSAFKSGIQGLSPALREVAQAFGGTAKQQKELYTDLVKTQAIDQQVKALQTLQRQLGKTAEETLALARTRNLPISAEAVAKFAPIQEAEVQLSHFKQIADKLRDEYRKLATGAGVEPSAAAEKLFVKEGILKEQYQNTLQLAKGYGIAKEGMQQFFAEQGKSALFEKMNPVTKLTQDLVVLGKTLSGQSEEYRRFSELVYTAGVKPAAGDFGKYEQALRDKSAVAAMKELGETLGWTTQKLKEEAEAAGFTQKMLDQLGATSRKTAEATKTLSGQSEEYRRFSELVYTSGAKPAAGDFGKYEQALRDKSAVAAMKELGETLGWTTQKLKEEAEAAGFTQKMLDQLSGSAEKATKASKSIRDIAPSAKFTSESLTELSAKFDRISTAAGRANEIKELARSLDLDTNSAIKLAKSLGYTTEEIKRYEAAQRKAQSAGRGVSGIFTPSSLSAGAQSGAAAVGVTFGAYGAVELGKSAYQASLKMENLNLAFQSIFGSAEKATSQLQFVRSVSDELGLSFLSTAEGAKKLFAAARGTVLEKDAQSIFKSFSSMGAALKLTSDEMNSVFLAVAQMISKGKVSAEELRLQLSERMPGAVTLFAKSIGKTTAELDKMLQAGQVGLESLRNFSILVGETYAEGARGASQGLQAQINRLGNAWFDLKKAFVDTDGSAKVIVYVTEAVKGLGAAAPYIVNTIAALMKFGTAVAAMYAASKAIGAIVAGIVVLKATFASTVAASLVLTAAFAKLKVALLAFAATPLGAAIALGLVATGIYELSTKQTEGQKVLESYNGSLDDFSTKAEEAAKNIKNMNLESLLSLEKVLQEKLKTAQAGFATLHTPTPKFTFSMGMSDTFNVESGFSQALEKLKTSPLWGKTQNDLIKNAQDLGKSFSASFADVMAKGDPEKTRTFFRAYYDDFEIIKSQLKDAGASKDVIDTFDQITGSMLKNAREVDNLTAAMKELKKEQELFAKTGISVDVKGFMDATESIKKLTEGTKLGKEAALTTKFEEIAGHLKKASEEAPKFEAIMVASGDKTSEAYKTAEARVKGFNEAFDLSAQLALETKGGTDLLIRAIESLGGQEANLDKIRAAMQRIASVDLTQGIQDFTKNIRFKIETFGLESNIKAAAEKLYKSAEAGTKPADIVKALKTKDFSGIKFTAGAVVSKEDLNNLADYTTQMDKLEASAKGASKAETSLKTINKEIEDGKRKIEEWQAKINEKKGESFAVTLGKELSDLDKAMVAAKGNKALIADLQAVRNEMALVGEARRKQIEDEERLAGQKSYAKDLRRITSEFKKLQGFDNADVFESAKTQYDIDLAEFTKYLNEKIITREQYDNAIRMMDANLADAQLRSQTDLYSRLQVTVNDYFKKYGDFTKNIGGVITKAMDASAAAIANFAVSGARDFKSLGDAFAKMAEDMLRMAAELFAQQALAGLIKGAFSLFNTGSSSSTGIGSSGWTGGAGGGSGMLGGVSWFSAKGNVFPAGNLSAYSNSVVSSPTLFSTSAPITAFAKGGGLMGEAGPEAVMPLIRDSSGRLGVRSEGEGSAAPMLNQNINVNIINNTDSTVSQKETKDDQGNVQLDIMIEKQVASSMTRPGSAPYRALNNVYGARPVLASR